MFYLDKRTEEHVLFIMTREHENMFYLDKRTEEHVLFIMTREHENMFYLLRQENMRTRGEVAGLIEQKENMRFGWALPNTRCLRILT